MNWLRYKKIYFSISGVLIAACLFGLLKWGLKLSLDFTGGTIVEYEFGTAISKEELAQKLEDESLQTSSIQETSQGSFLIKLPPVGDIEKEKLASVSASISEDVNELRFETVGPSVGPELIKKTVYAVLIAAGTILLWVAYQFKNFKFGISAILAMFHDSFILVGSFSLLGHFFGAEVDFLFVTALLTTLSFSVHDTIVVFDRIREIGGKGYLHKSPRLPTCATSEVEVDEVESVANQALTETMVRSLNNSFTIAFMLLALILMGGVTVRWFAVALFIGTILGTYSSPFVAVPLLVSWDELFSRIKLLINRQK